MANPRAVLLNKLFNSTLTGSQVVSARQGPLFLQAICSQADPALCFGRVMESPIGKTSLQAAMHSDMSPAFHNGSATALFSYMKASHLKSIEGGNFLNQVLLHIVEPPIFWNSFRNAFVDKKLSENAQASFSWLLLQLISLPGELAGPYRQVAGDATLQELLLTSSNLETRANGQKIKNIVETFSNGALTIEEYAPGGRHDNDQADFRKISILPTADELASTEIPFLRPSSWLEDEETKDHRTATYLDNHFRLLREDMLYELREDLQIATGKKKGHHHGMVINGLTLWGLYHPRPDRRCKWSIALKCRHDFWQLKGIRPKDRMKHLNDNPKILKHQSCACLLSGTDVIGFVTIHRDEELLARFPPVIAVQLQGQASVIKALIALKTAGPVTLVQIDTALFSYEPILKSLQDAKSVPLSSELLFLHNGSDQSTPPARFRRIIEAIKREPGCELQRLLRTPKSIKLDKSQAASLVSGLSQNVSLIQGPPGTSNFYRTDVPDSSRLDALIVGTGKSFIGALITKALHDFTSKTVLVVCYTNHALDQFLEDLLDVDIPAESMVRLGSKCTPRTEPLALQNQTTMWRQGESEWKATESLKAECHKIFSGLKDAFRSYRSSAVRDSDVLEFIDFEDPEFYDAFIVPDANGDMTTVGKDGRAVTPDYLLSRWSKGLHAGVFRNHAHVQKASGIWNMALPLRKIRIAGWKEKMLRDRIESVCSIGKTHDDRLSRLEWSFRQKSVAILKGKRIIGCTTTAAAKYHKTIQAASPSVLLVEEAGEILESHILAAMGPKTEQLVLIGDHKYTVPSLCFVVLGSN
jgi:hypothetical protein